MSILGALAGAVAGTLSAFAIGSLYAKLARVSSFEGKAGYLVVWGFGPIGLVAGLIAGGAWAFGAHHGAAVGVVVRDVLIAALAIVGAAAGALALYARRGGGPLVTNEASPQLLFRIRVPESATEWRVELHTPYNSADGRVRDRATDADGRIILRGFVDLYFRTTRRTLVLRAPDGTDHLFMLRLPASPLAARHKSWTPWRPADWIAGPGEQPRRAGPGFDVAYRVSRASDPPDA